MASGRDLNAFLKVPWPIYAEDPQWVPQLLLDQKEFLDRRKHPFYLHGAAEKFIAYRDGVPQGRILVSDDPRYNAEHQSNTGCFGMFESADDPEMAQGLIDAAAKWLRDRGRTAILGPIDYSTNYSCGLLVEGFDTPPRIMDNHNPPYYAGLLESCGPGARPRTSLVGGSSIRRTWATCGASGPNGSCAAARSPSARSRRATSTPRCSAATRSTTGPWNTTGRSSA